MAKSPGVEDEAGVFSSCRAFGGKNESIDVTRVELTRGFLVQLKAGLGL